MSVILRPLGPLKNYIDGQSERLVEPGRSVRQTLMEAGIPPEIVALVMVKDGKTQHEEQQSKDYILQEGDTAKLIAVIGGG